MPRLGRTRTGDGESGACINSRNTFHGNTQRTIALRYYAAYATLTNVAIALAYTSSNCHKKEKERYQRQSMRIHLQIN
ncbi:hypothetical protein, partial [Pseudoalteromonas sp.]|uniref:hypothetical protein n=1 Tax=Pseudoalteromonas sp. TaxID=53249 RepID=UPI00260580D3